MANEYDIYIDNLLNELPSWIQYLEFQRKELNRTPLGIKLLQSLIDVVNDRQEEFYDGVYNQAFVDTATGSDLTRIGEKYSISRGSLSDVDYRTAIKGAILQRQEGATLNGVFKYLEGQGYVVDRYEKAFDYQYVSDIGHNKEEDNANYGTFFGVTGDNNYITYIYVTPTPTVAQISTLETEIRTIGKVLPKVYIRGA